MLTPRVLSRRSFLISNLCIEHRDSAWRSTLQYDELVQLEWNNILRRAKTRVWDGVYYRVLNPDALAQENQPAPILLGTVAYRYIATFPSLYREHSRLALDPLSHLSTVALIRTTDDLYVFGVRKQNGVVDLIGGGAQRDEVEIQNGTDLERNLHKEFFEEVGLNRADIHNLTGIGVVVSSTSNVLIVGHAQLTVTSAEVEKNFQFRTDEEMKRLVFVSAPKLREYLLQMNDYRRLLAQFEL